MSETGDENAAARIVRAVLRTEQIAGRRRRRTGPADPKLPASWFISLRQQQEEATATQKRRATTTTTTTEAGGTPPPRPGAAPRRRVAGKALQARIKAVASPPPEPAPAPAPSLATPEAPPPQTHSGRRWTAGRLRAVTGVGVTRAASLFRLFGGPHRRTGLARRRRLLHAAHKSSPAAALRLGEGRMRQEFWRCIAAVVAERRVYLQRLAARCPAALPLRAARAFPLFGLEVDVVHLSLPTQQPRRGVVLHESAHFVGVALLPQGAGGDTPVRAAIAGQSSGRPTAVLTPPNPVVVQAVKAFPGKCPGTLADLRQLLRQPQVAARLLAHPVAILVGELFWEISDDAAPRGPLQRLYNRCL